MKPTTDLMLDNVGSPLPADNSENGADIARIRWHLDDACRRLAAGDATLALIAVQDADELLADLEGLAA